MGFLNDEKQKAFVLEKISGLRLLDDVLMTVVLNHNVTAVQEIVGTISGNARVRIISAKTQETVVNLNGKSVRFDLIAEDSRKRTYDIEIQRAASGASPERMRYNSAVADTLLLNSGEKHRKLPDSTVIFFMEDDLFGAGIPIYHVERTIKELKRDFRDGSHVIIVNGAYENNRTKIGRLIHDFRCADPDEMYSEILAESVRRYKQTEEGVKILRNEMLNDFERKLWETSEEELIEKCWNKRKKEIGEKCWNKHKKEIEENLWNEHKEEIGAKRTSKQAEDESYKEKLIIKLHKEGKDSDYIASLLDVERSFVESVIAKL